MRFRQLSRARSPGGKCREILSDSESVACRGPGLSRAPGPPHTIRPLYTADENTNENTNTSGYYCYGSLAAEDARYQTMIHKYGSERPSHETEYNRHHRNISNYSYQATTNNMGMERRRMRKEPDNQSSGNSMAKIARKTAADLHSDDNEDPYDSDSESLAQHIIFPILCRTCSRPDSPMSVQPLPWSTVTICCRQA